ncbi:olfactory receptor 11A1-like [Malaclemys terrapin pileata]|uniref:olfactory receptor 11A1-like n=1 Tax=Malaclemys terrapin pileata TaxID=2991368 RepID=UPI0023A7FDCE|nr:olfactory receptor 11A1-like [Malaclemys terrapin pileata]
MKDTDSGILTTISHILLLGFGDLKELWILFFTGFLAVYIISMAANLLLVVLVLDPHLQTPMYFFLSSLSCLEMVSTSNISPVILAGLQAGNVTISLGGCLAQLYLFGALATVECFLLAAMSYDRYLAMCHPLHCGQLVVGSWVGGFLFMGIVSLSLIALSFCGPCEIDHYFCDFQPLLELSCTNTPMVQMVTFFLSFIPASPFLLTVTSYICITCAVLRVPSVSGRHKAFSICSSHLTVMMLFYGTLVSPRDGTGLNPRKELSLLYTVLTPLLNPLVYSLRNQEVSKACGRVARMVSSGGGSIMSPAGLQLMAHPIAATA